MDEQLVLSIIIEREENGYVGDCPSLQGCHAQGSTYEEAFANIRDAVGLHIEDRKACGEPIERLGTISFTTLEVAA